MLALSIVLAGFPAQAMQACPMMKAQMAQASQDGTADCHMATKVKINKCCTDPACDAKCSALSGGISIDLPAMRATLALRDGKSLRLSLMADALTSQLLATQERPPRILA
jgi:hypothetical protein